MPQTNKKKPVAKKPAPVAVKKELEPMQARCKYKGKEIVVDLFHAISVIEKNGGEIIEHTADETALCVLCDTYEVNYGYNAGIAQLMEALRKRF